jgi:hypothetical protein
MTFMTNIWQLSTALRGFTNINVGYWISDKSLFWYPIQCWTLRSSVRYRTFRYQAQSDIADHGYQIECSPMLSRLQLGNIQAVEPCLCEQPLSRQVMLYILFDWQQLAGGVSHCLILTKQGALLGCRGSHASLLSCSTCQLAYTLGINQVPRLQIHSQSEVFKKSALILAKSTLVNKKVQVNSISPIYCSISFSPRREWPGHWAS